MGSRVIPGLVATYVALLIAGCAGITVSKAPTLGSTDDVQGVPWNLAMTRFTVTITRHITTCGKEIKGKVETLASASTLADPEERYLLTTNGWFATSDIKSTLSTTGFNTGLNAETTDATTTVIGNVIGTAAQIAIGFASAAAGKDGKKTPDQICTPELLAAVETLYPANNPSLKKTVDKATEALASKTADVAVLSAQAAANKDDQVLKARLVQALADQEKARIDLQQKQDMFTAALKASTDIQTVTWPSKSSEFYTAKPFSIDESVLDNWIVADVDGPNATKQLDIYLALYTQPAEGGWITPTASTPAHLDRGVPVRLPRPAKLAMCTGKACPSSFKAGEKLAESQTTADFAVLQVGPTYSLPVSGGAFRSESAAITLDTNGIPTVLQTTEKVAAASALTGATKDAATQMAGLPASIRAAEFAKTKAEIDQANADIALQTAKQTAGLQGQTSTLAAQTALINAQLANAAAQQNASIQGFQQQAGSLNAQASVMQAQAVLATAQANSQVVDQTSVLGAQTTLLNAQTALLNAANAQVKAQTQALP